MTAFVRNALSTSVNTWNSCIFRGFQDDECDSVPTEGAEKNRSTTPASPEKTGTQRDRKKDYSAEKLINDYGTNREHGVPSQAIY